MKKLIFALATIGIAAMMTACDDDESSSAGGGSGDLISCDMKVSQTIMGKTFEEHSCGEGPNTSENQALIKEYCQTYDEEGLTVTAKIGSGCPSGADKVCDDEGGKTYFYNASGLSCEELMGDDED